MTVAVLVVVDSPTMRGLITAALRRDPEIEVVGSAADPLEAREAIKRLNPDVITLDIEMPNMNGLEFLEKIMRLRPMPVVMVSTLTQAGAGITPAALELGAVDAVGKPSAGITAMEAFADLAAKVKVAARSRVRAGGAVPAARPDADYRANKDLVLAIGASTGGVEALLTILSSFPADCPATAVTQHMPATFTSSFAARLNKSSAATVEEASDGAPLTTILGSCVAMCLRDPAGGVGGMNHFLLPEGPGPDAGRRYGAYAMEVLINDCLKRGARRDRMEAKLFGGGRMFDSLQDVGRANADFAERFLRDEGIALAGGSLRGAGGRRVQYWPVTGRALQRSVSDHSPPLAAVLAARPAVAPDAGAVELF